MKRLSIVIGCAAVLVSAPLAAQSNSDSYTPLNSRIKRKNAFPTEPRRTFDFKKSSSVGKKRSKAMLGQFSRCLYNRSNERSLNFLAKTDFGFVSFEQIGTNGEELAQLFGFHDCLGRVAESNNSGVALRFYPNGLRQWLLETAYFDQYPDDASWVKPGNVVKDRVYPLSENVPEVQVAMNFADCVVAADPHTSDFYFRTPSGSEDEKLAVKELMPSLSGCISEGRELKLDPSSLRVWLGEALWHASNNSAPAEADSSEVTQ
ncbi:hypothetical protein H0274_04910 [Altererythrobacter sp. CC-YST694]|uniref:hypothetical protein n=1 Tax=Altererythrobacter sp. CC-YST694 TaxID=2755038 RepID=UPI001D0118BC|nr:hypothetical protein [Altererythrobacter sp. CC-YST694]MCB5424589.1 hypothetical protein [Altererythrobacter sp. CC-YST694]